MEAGKKREKKVDLCSQEVSLAYSHAVNALTLPLCGQGPCMCAHATCKELRGSLLISRQEIEKGNQVQWFLSMVTWEIRSSGEMRTKSSSRFNTTHFLSALSQVWRSRSVNIHCTHAHVEPRSFWVWWVQSEQHISTRRVRQHPHEAVSVLIQRCRHKQHVASVQNREMSQEVTLDMG